MCFLRHLDEADAERDSGFRAGCFATASPVLALTSEAGHPPSKFKNVFRRARDAGLFVTAHAGEEGPPSYVWGEALDVLPAYAVSIHGNRSLEDQALVGRLARERMALTVCPLSNLRLRVIDDILHHPLRRMMDQGLVVTVNSDDPAYFGGYINDNYNAVGAALSLQRDEIAAIVRNSILASLMTDPAKSDALAEIDQVMTEST